VRRPCDFRASALSSALSLGAIALSACRGLDARPTAALSRSIDAENELRPLLAAWARGSRAERIAMEPAITAFRRRYGADDAARLAEVLLAWIALEKGDLRAAQVAARRIGSASGPGTVADIAHTVEGASLRRQGQPGPALDLLAPLVNKLIDPWARALCNHEVVHSAVEAGRWPQALALMRVWLREAVPAERAAARAAIEEALTRAPAADLLAVLERDAAAGADEDMEMRKLVVQRLAFLTRAAKDAQLAQRLLGRAGDLLGEQGEVVAQLAAGASRARVEPRTVGLLVSLRDDAARKRGAEIVQGVAFGLGLPGSAARLVSRDDHGSRDRVDEALLALSADGASLLIAGSDEQEANQAAAFAEAHHIPMLLLRAPAPDRKKSFTFVVGVDCDDVETVLVAALVTRSASPVAILAEDAARPRPSRPDVAQVRGCGDASLPWATASQHVAGAVLAAGVDCARDGLAAPTAHRIRFAASFEASALSLPAGSVVATAGAFPFVAASPALEVWSKHHQRPPGWWVALGRDAAMLAWAAVQALPARSTEEPGEVEARRVQVAASLAAAQADLWTTDASGFRGARTLPRTVGVREVGALSRP
jgi:hypothetical protein